MSHATSIQTDRQQQILDLLAQQGVVRVDELSSHLGVSTMTVHRDLKNLERAGQLRKVRGGAVPAEQAPKADDACLACYTPPSLRTQVVLHFADGSQRRACCPHCGLLALSRSQESVTAFLVTDFLYGRVVNGRTATYVATPSVSVCCTPTVLVFESAHDARRFQNGFGGHILNLDEALTFLQAEMHL